MTGNETPKTFRFEKGAVYLYRRPNTRVWWTRQRKADGSGWARLTTGCTEFEEAVSKALEIYRDAQFRHRYGLTGATKTFRQAAAELVKKLEAKAAAGKRDGRYVRNAKRFLDRYACAFFGDMPVDQITTKDVNDYVEWRERYWVDGPGAGERQTIKQGDKTVERRTRHGAQAASGEWSWLRMTFDVAVAKGWMQKARVPEINVTRAKPNRRPAFSDEDFEKLGKASVDWLEEGKGGVHRRIRWLTVCFVGALMASGLRTGEARALRWRDVGYVTVKGKRFLRLNVRGKTGPRPVVPLQGLEDWLDDIRQQHPDPSPDQPVFATAGHEGKLIQPDLARSFLNWLAHAEVTHDGEGNKYTLYSLRHTYATKRLQDGRVNVHALAKNMGTSTPMIDRHYSHLTAVLAAEELTRTYWPKDEREDAVEGDYEGASDPD